MSSNEHSPRRPASFITFLTNALLASLRYMTMYSAQMVDKTAFNKCYIAPHSDRLGNLKERQLLHNENSLPGFLSQHTCIPYSI